MLVYAMWTALSTTEGTHVATSRLPALGLLLAGAIAVAPAVLAGVPAGSAAPRTVADTCGGGINIGLIQEGAPVTSNCGPVGPPPITSGAPSQQTLTACSGIPGCLSNALYGPGNVQVPQPNTTVQQSQ